MVWPMMTVTVTNLRASLGEKFGFWAFFVQNPPEHFTHLISSLIGKPLKCELIMTSGHLGVQDVGYWTPRWLPLPWQK